MYAATMTTMTAEKPADLAYIRRLGDPQEKLRLVAELIERTEDEIEPRRLRRNAAAVLLYRRANAEAAAKGRPVEQWPMKPAAMWRDTLDVSRSLWHKIVHEADPEQLAALQAKLAALQTEIRDLPDEQRGQLTRLAREVEKLQRKLARHIDQVKAVDELAGTHGGDADDRLLDIARSEAAAVHRMENEIAEAKPMRDELARGLMNGGYGAPVPNAQVARLARRGTAWAAMLRTSR